MDFYKFAKIQTIKKRYQFDKLPHKSYVYGLNDGWACDYPKLNEIMEKYDLYDQIELCIQ